MSRDIAVRGSAPELKQTRCQREADEKGLHYASAENCDSRGKYLEFERVTLARGKLQEPRLGTQLLCTSYCAYYFRRMCIARAWDAQRTWFSHMKENSFPHEDVGTAALGVQSRTAQ